MNHRTQGFTLIEMSIVLVIIGLIVGGVLVGRELILSAKLRSVLTDIERFNTAANTFRGKYDCLPGDCSNATTFFGAFASCIPGGGYNLGNATCNGNGDGNVLYTAYGDQSTTTVNYWQYDETAQFWQQLSLAKLVAGNYSGAFHWNGQVVPGENVPVSQLEGGCYTINAQHPSGEAADYPYNSMGSHFFTLGNNLAYDGTGPAWQGFCSGGLYSLPASAAYKIDSKIDDGKPFTGSVQAPPDVYGGNFNDTGNSPPGCTNMNVTRNFQTTVYMATAPGSACQLFFKATF